MGWSLKQSTGGDEAVRRADYPWLHAFFQSSWEGASDTPQWDVHKGKWQICSPETASHFSGVGFFFAEALHKFLGEGVPIALIQTAMGGTAIETWIDRPSLEASTAGRVGSKFFKEAVGSYLVKKAAWDQAKSEWQKQADAAKADGQPEWPLPEDLRKEPQGVKPLMLPAALFNGKVAPLQPYASRGVLWYQGESNAGSQEAASRYGQLLELLIQRWRAGFRDSNLPFLVIQLPGYGCLHEPKSDWPTLREHQDAVVRKTPHTGLVVSIDLGEQFNIHPGDKRSIGERASLLARRMAYGDSFIPAEGPRFLSASRRGETLRLAFRKNGKLVTTDGTPPEGFEVSLAQGEFTPVEARIDGEESLLSAPASGPACVRYAWKNWAQVNTSDGSGLPLAPFMVEVP
jgi:sialate O-acetylesterase